MQHGAIVAIHLLHHPSLSYTSSFLLFPYNIETCIWIVLIPELINDCTLNGWCPFLASIDDGLPEELIEPSQALFQPASIHPVGPIASMFFSVMMACSSIVICILFIPHFFTAKSKCLIRWCNLCAREWVGAHFLQPPLCSCNFG